MSIYFISIADRRQNALDNQESMNMKNITKAILGIALLLCVPAQAKLQLGGMVGGNFNNFRTTVKLTNGSETVGLTPRGDFGYQVGGIIRFDDELWGVELNPTYSSRSLQLHGDYATYKFSTTMTLKQLELPIIGYYKFNTNSVDYRFGLGALFTYGYGKVKSEETRSYTVGTETKTKGNYDWDTYGLKKFNAGAVIGIGADLTISEKFILGLELRGHMIFTDMKSSTNGHFAGDRMNYNSLDLLASFVW